MEQDRKFDYFEDMLDYFEGKESKYKYPEPIELSVYDIIGYMDYVPDYFDDITDEDIEKAYFKPYVKKFAKLNDVDEADFKDDNDFIKDYNFYLSDNNYYTFNVEAVKDLLYDMMKENEANGQYEEGLD